MVAVNEIDNTMGATPGVTDITYGGAVIEAAWGEVNKPHLVQNENDLVRIFSKPNDNNYKSWLSAANYLSYAGNLWVVRATAPGLRNAVAKPEKVKVEPDGEGAPFSYTENKVFVKKDEDGNVVIEHGQPVYYKRTMTTDIGAEVLKAAGNVVFANRVEESSEEDGKMIVSGISSQDVSSDIVYDNRATDFFIDNLDTYISIFDDNDYDSIFAKDNPYGLPEGGVGEFAARYAGSIGNSILVSYADSNTFANWKYRGQFSKAPGTSRHCAQRNGSNDELHLVVVDAGGRISGTKGTILEKYSFISKASDAKDLDGDSIYYRDVLNNRSAYVYWTGLPEVKQDAETGEWSGNYTDFSNIESTSFGNVSSVTNFASMAEPFMVRLGGGADDFNSTVANIAAAFDCFKNKEAYDISLIVCGAYRQELCQHVINEICETRKDCIAFFSPSVLMQEGETDNKLIVEDDEEDLLAKNGEEITVEIDGEQKTVKSDFVVAISDCAYEPESERITPTFSYADDSTSSGTLDVTKRRLNALRYLREETIRYRKTMRQKHAAYGATGYLIETKYGTDPVTGTPRTFSADEVGTYVYVNEENEFSSSYGILDSGWKLIYDKYNDVYRWIPLNSDTAGAYARTDVIKDPWWSAAGYNRGSINNVVRLSYSPDKNDRDKLYPNGINPVINVLGEGTILYGNKTLLNKPSAFQQVNVRRLFIYCERILSRAARYLLFELNDDITRATARAMCETPLREVQGSRGIIQFKVICDSTNNTSEIINNNQLVIDIYVQPNRALEYVVLNFIAENDGSSVFSEVG